MTSNRMLETSNTKTFKFHCHTCEYYSNNKKDYEKHILTLKHQNNQISNINLTDKIQCESDDKQFICDICERIYKSRVGLWQHKNTNKNKCTPKINTNTNINAEEYSPKLIKLLTEIIKGQTTLQETVCEVIKNGITNNNSHNITTTNSHNKTAFNLNLYLNETCKDAMNLSDFIKSIKPSLTDLERTGQIGYVDGISSIILNSLNNIDVKLRPIHCSDVKREVLYVKENDEWQKDSEDNMILKSAIRNVAKDNMDNILEWKKANPGCTESDSKKNDKYLKIVSNSMAGTTKEEINKNIGKIVSNIAKNVTINKQLN